MATTSDSNQNIASNNKEMEGSSVDEVRPLVKSDDVSQGNGSLRDERCSSTDDISDEISSSFASAPSSDASQGLHKLESDEGRSSSSSVYADCSTSVDGDDVGREEKQESFRPCDNVAEICRGRDDEQDTSPTAGGDGAHTVCVTHDLNAITDNNKQDRGEGTNISSHSETEPIAEALKELLRVTPDKSSRSSKPQAEASPMLSPPLSGTESSHSIAMDDPAIVTSSDLFSSNMLVNNRGACGFSEGDGNAHVMNLLRKSFQAELVNKGDGDTAVQIEKLFEKRMRTDSSTSTTDDACDDGTKTSPRTLEARLRTRSEDGVITASKERPIREMLVRRQASQTNMPSSDKPVLETLTFGTSLDEGDGVFDAGEAGVYPKKEIDTSCPCPMCDRSFPSDTKEDVLAHLVLVHKFVIADVNFIGNLAVYLRYWKERLKTRPISEFCSKIVTNTGVKDEADKEEFYLLCDALPEDKTIRKELQRKKLEQVLAQQQRERDETKFCRHCLFCKQTFCGNRSVLFEHLLRDHMFHMGQPDNLVFTDELFDLIEFKLDNLLCLFCEKSFKDNTSLREHMRKKQHRRINPKNKEYDRFYIINYMEMGKNWVSLQQEDARLVNPNEVSDDEEWADWNEESLAKVVCLFCDAAFVHQQELYKHMKGTHSFDLLEVNKDLQLNFYQKVKLINYIRRQVYHKTCYACQCTFSEKHELTDHMTDDTDHINKLPVSSIWDQSQYFFPTYEDDNLLCQLDDDDEGASGDMIGVTVIAEDIPVVTQTTILRDEKLCRDLLKA